MTCWDGRVGDQFVRLLEAKAAEDGDAAVIGLRNGSYNHLILWLRSVLTKQCGYTLFGDASAPVCGIKPV
jgi:hypothetical protein